MTDFELKQICYDICDNLEKLVTPLQNVCDNDYANKLRCRTIDVLRNAAEEIKKTGDLIY